MTREQFMRGVNTVGYAVVAYSMPCVPGTQAMIPHAEDGRITQVFHHDRLANYEDCCAYTSAAFACDTRQPGITNAE